ncbi:hypothetical protein AvCA_10150 [Azotobacter vinelandii CA]|uniref:DUF4892 domain-containing protein n=2 Tax=Azotobacter vinelandii TaxID=354 RepID=C1DNN1_AZOVD|nr:DUF4892 domain-containing protein [Azotobacter vinelandii]ACO77247.1 conserved hypothetical protein [Azotobacter vinelandii DJ]AGK15431.1 hypothetical protein AvCA_10150 [Azotobacter vinelandii CA]AGK19667.1 hypothetical protein AvCA6_10150 [Azotobacter vinelandii CA6]WKN22932.1 DUF4892 domain-containing protein [Azotobacter vinelandii]SFX63508.1 protein of unknown function [Azotobacter vinelandii]
MRLSTFCCLLLAGSSLLAADLPDGHDHEVLPRFPQAEIVESSQGDAERRYPLGGIQRISGRLRYEREVLAEGWLSATTYRLPVGHLAAEAFAQARESLLRQGAELLYWCDGRDCGSSSLWANTVFGNARLYGPDERQAFALLRLAAPRRDSLLALYAITRGNRRDYLHVERLDAAAALGELLPTPATLLRQLRTDGQLLLPALSGEPGAAWVDVLARSLMLDSTLRVALAGAQASAWRGALIERGVRAARLELDETAVDGLRLSRLP